MDHGLNHFHLTIQLFRQPFGNELTVIKVVPNQGCNDDEVEKSTGKKKIKSRIVLNTRDVDENEYIKSKKMK